MSTFTPDFEPQPEAADSQSALTSARALSGTVRLAVRERNRAHRSFILRATAAVIALVGGCGEGTSPPPEVATVSVSPESAELVAAGTQMLAAIAKDAKGTTLVDRITTWSVADPSIATVAGGLVTGVALGTTTVTASVEGKSASAEVRVKDGAIVGASGNSFSDVSGNLSVVVPPGAVAQTMSFTVAPMASPPPSARLLNGTAFDLGPAATTFAQPITVTIKYNPALVTAGNSETELMLYEVVSGAWRVVAGSTVNTTSKTVSGNISHLGNYAVMMLPRVLTVTVGGDPSPFPVITTRQLTATLKDDEGTTLTRPVSWSSSNPAVLSIDAATGLALAKTPGAVTITATSEGKSGTATMTVVPGPPSKLIAWAGNNQSVAAGSAVPTPPSVQVTDAGDNPIAGVTVNFSVAAGGGTITGATATTNASGIAAVGSWTLGPSAGPNSLTAISPAVTGTTITFNAAGGAGPAARVEMVDGNNQTATAGGLVATQPSVKVTDANGNFVAGFSVTFTPGAGSGSVTAGTVVTDAGGIARVGSWRLGATPGAQTLIATAGGLTGSPVTFTATGVAPVASTIAGFAGNNQSARPGFAVATPPSVIVTDPAGIPVPGIAVTFAVTAGGGSVSGASATTGANGIATVGSWTLGATAGANTLTASSGTLTGSPVVFNATGAAPPPTTMTIFAGDNQTALAGQPVPVAPAVKVTDAEGFGVAGVNVVFSIRSGSGTITGASTVTNASGVATLGTWVLGIGGNSLFVNTSALPNIQLVFVALGTAEVQIVTFGDSNTDFGFLGTSPIKRVGSYVSSGDPAIRLSPNAPNDPLQLAGMIEARWRANRTKTIKAVNHGISGTLTGAGRTIVLAPNALEAVGGVTRFRGEVMGHAYPWSGGEEVNSFYPNGAIARTNAFTPRTSDFAYISIGTNDVIQNVPLTTIKANLEIMVDTWIAAGLPRNRLMITTLSPISQSANTAIPALNNLIRTLASAKGIRLIDVAVKTSADNGATWLNSSRHVGDFLHYSEAVRNEIADEVVQVMLDLNP